MKLNVVPLVLVTLTLFLPGLAFAATGVMTIQPDEIDGKDTFYTTSSFFAGGSPNTEYMSVGGWGDEYFAYIQFDLSQLPDDAIVTNASMELFQDTVGKNYNEITALRITGPWEEHLVSKSNNPPAVDAGIGWVPAPSVVGWWVVDVTDLVTNWMNGTHPNYGVKLDGRYTTNNHIRLFHTSDYMVDASLRPKLVIEYTVPDEPEPEKTPEELVASLQEVVNTEVPAKSTKNSYFAHIDKLLQFFNGAQVEAALNQIGALLRKVSFDVLQKDLEQEVADEIVAIAEELETVVDAQTIPDVPLVTQVASPYPPESSVWAEMDYADGRGNVPAVPWQHCGQTIRQCGCALTSFVMLGLYYGIEKGIDGSEVTPPNLDSWLLANDGYDSYGNIFWTEAIKYYGKEIAGVTHSYFKWDADNLKNFDVIYSYLKNKKPVVLETNILTNSGKTFTHFILGSFLNKDVTYVRDPLWYETSELNNTKDTQNHIQDYNNEMVSGRLFEFSKNPQVVSRALQINLGSPAELLLTDSQGRRLGKDPNTNSSYDEIPGGIYYEEASVYSDEAAASGKSPHVTKILYLSAPSDDAYTLSVLGTAAGEYSLSVYTNDSMAKGHVTELEGNTNEGQNDTFLLDIEVGDGELQNIITMLYDAASSLGDSDREKVVMMLEVIEDKVEKNNVMAAESKIANLLAYIAHKDITDSATLVTLLEELLQSLE